MKLVIDIPEDYQRLCPEYYPYCPFDLVVSQILQAVKKGAKLEDAEAYHWGYTDGVSRVDEAYERGLSDAWECARKLCQCEDEGGLGNHCGEIFSRKDFFDIFDYSAAEAIRKLKEYEGLLLRRMPKPETSANLYNRGEWKEKMK